MKIRPHRPHILCHADSSTCARAVPMAKKEVDRLLRQGKPYMRSWVQGPGYEIMVEIIRNERIIHIWGGEVELAISGVISRVVEQDGVEETVTERRELFADKPGKPFRRRVKKDKSGEYAGYSQFVFASFTSANRTEDSVPYPVPNEDDENVQLVFVDFSFGLSQKRRFRRFDSSQPSDFTGDTSVAHFGGVIGDVSTRPAPFNEVIGLTEEGEYKIFSVGYTGFGNEDEGGVEVGEPYHFTWNSNSQSPLNLFPTDEIPGTDMPRHWNIPRMAVVGENKAFVVLVSRWTYTRFPGNFEPQATARVLYTTDAGSTWTVWNISEDFFKDWGEQKDPESFELDPTIQNEANGINDVLIGTSDPQSKTIPMDNNEALYLNIFLLPNQAFITRIFHLKPNAAPELIVDINHGLFTPADLDGPVLYWMRDVKYVGHDTLIAKVIPSFSGTGLDVWFYVSTDRGKTWAVRDFTGADFPNPGYNEYFGNLTVVEPATEEQDAVVVMPTFDETKSAYVVYVTRNHGVSWEEFNVLATTTEFSRMDTALADDDGPNFEEVVYVGPKGNPNPINVAVPILGV